MRRVVISDIHGCAAELERLLQKTKAQPEEVIFLGDYVDSGPDSMRVLDMVIEWCKHGAEALLGNHDDLFLEWLEGKEHIFYYGRIGGIATINSFLRRLGMDLVENSHLEDDEAIENRTREAIRQAYSAHVSFLQSLPLFKRESDTVFVHAGINPKDGLEKTRRIELLNIREEFIYQYSGEEKVIFGHTRTKRIHQSNHVYFGPNRVIGIDGGCAFGGQLNALIIDGDIYSEEAVAKLNHEDVQYLRSI